MRIIMMTDIEGVSGVVSFEDQAEADGKYYQQAKSLLTAEVNAAIEGLISEGVDDILVIDGHGVGGIIFEQLHCQAKLLHGKGAFLSSRAKDMYRKYDAAVMIGQHSMAGSKFGSLSHTQSNDHIEYYKLNGQYIGEIAQ